MVVKQDRIGEVLKVQTKCWGNLEDRETIFTWEEESRLHVGGDSHSSSEGRGYIVTRRSGTVGEG